jgi:hypothetical protein
MSTDDANSPRGELATCRCASAQTPLLQVEYGAGASLTAEKGDPRTTVKETYVKEGGLVGRTEATRGHLR